MNSKQVIDFIKHPAKLQKSEAEELQRVTEEYPYSGLLQALYLKALKNQNNYLYPKQLKRTAITVPDRKILYYWTEGEEAAEVQESPDKPKLVFKAEEKKAPEPLKVELTEERDQVKAEREAPTESFLAPTPEKQKEQVKATETTKTDDIDLAGLPASVRETVLRARRIREQFGKKYDGIQAEAKSPTEEPEKEIISDPISKEIAEAPVPEPSTPELKSAQAKEAVVPEHLVSSQPEVIEEREVEEEPILEVEFAAVIDEIESVEETNRESVDQSEPMEVEMHSFMDWLAGGESDEDMLDDQEQAFQPDYQVSEEPNALPHAEEKPSTEQVKELYDTFMESRPKPKLSFRAEDKPVDTASLGTSAYSQYITETLAQIYVKQKLYDRALNAYEILRLKYPEKSGFFAGRISEIKQLLNENN